MKTQRSANKADSGLIWRGNMPQAVPVGLGEQTFLNVLKPLCAALSSQETQSPGASHSAPLTPSPAVGMCHRAGMVCAEPAWLSLRAAHRSLLIACDEAALQHPSVSPQGQAVLTASLHLPRTALEWREQPGSLVAFAFGWMCWYCLTHCSPLGLICLRSCHPSTGTVSSLCPLTLCIFLNDAISFGLHSILFLLYGTGLMQGGCCSGRNRCCEERTGQLCVLQPSL